MFRILISLSFLFVAAELSAENREGDIRKIASLPTWSQLLHYESGYFHKARSSISQADWFYSPDGASHPESELIATIAAFTSDPEAQCRFPARAIFLKKHLQTLPAVDCPAFQDFIDAINPDSISLIYASGYLGNPASMYGHLFLKFNQSQTSELLDNTYNFGARYPDDVDPFSYIINGIFGGYQGYYANQKYHHQTLTYNESELRDLWEYELTLSYDDVVFVLAHLWEMQHSSMTYYFFKQNCAYQLAKLLELVVGQSLVAGNKVWVMPYDVIMQINRIEPALVRNVYYHPSRQEALYQKYSQLTAEEKQWLNDAINMDTTPDVVLANVDEPTAKRVIDTAYDYYAYLAKKNNGLSEEQAAQRDKLLNLRFKLPAGKSQFSPTISAPPHEAQNTALLQTSIVHNTATNNSGLALRFRANYYDLLTVNTARIPFSELSTFDLQLMYDLEQRKMYLREFTALKVVNLNATQTGLPGDGGYAWKVAVGVGEQQLEQTGNVSLYADGFIGKSVALGNYAAIYGALSASLTGKNNEGGNLSVGPEIGGVISITPEYALALTARHQRYVNDTRLSRTTFELEQRFSSNKQYDIRSKLHYNKAWEISVSLALYY